MPFRKLFLHIGLGKTGTSALQYWLSLNHGKLKALGYSYADLVEKAKTGAITSGNGQPLRRAFNEGNETEIRRLIDEVYFDGYSKSIISSESFQSLNNENLELMRQICAEQNIELRAIAFARSVYEQCYSVYLQTVKRAGATHRFGDKPVSYRVTANVLRRYADGFGNRFDLLNYDQHRNNLLITFLQACEVPLGTLPLDLSRKVNRSLTIEETNVLVAMNVLHGGEFSTEISDFLIYRAPEVETPVVFAPKVLEMLRQNSAGDLAWVNQTFFMQDSDQQLPIIQDSTILSAKSEEFPDSP